MKHVCVLSVLGLIFFACQPKSNEKKQSIAYDITNFRIESEGGCKADTIACAYYEVRYPVFHSMDTLIANILQKKIDAAVSMGNPEAEGESMKEIGEGFIEDFEDFKNEMPDMAMGWHYAATVRVEVLTDSLLSLSVAEEYFTGGAHGGHGTYFINIKPSTGEEFTLDNLLKAGYNEPLRKMAEREFRKVRELLDTASLAENMFEFPDNTFQLNNNYGFTKKGVVFYFNSYEIAAYAAGPTEVVVPYDSLRLLLR